MTTCAFFGHRECHGLELGVLRDAIETLIRQGVTTFYVGNQGQFDSMVYSCLKQLRKFYPHIRVAVVLAYLPAETQKWADLSDTVYPEGIELGPQRFALERRNKWLVDHADYCLCYISHARGGAYKFARLARRRGKRVFNLCAAEIDL